MGFDKVSFEDSLLEEVLTTGKCVGCGTCVVTCPFNCLEYKEEKPILVSECKTCGICAQVCPQYRWSRSGAERFVFGRERKSEEEFGIYRRLSVAKAKRPEVTLRQDGGAVTTLLLFALRNGVIDSAIVSGTSQERPLYPIPTVATTPEEILRAAGTRYSYSANILALKEAVDQKREKVAFVGTPCQIRAIRKLQMAGLKKYAGPLTISIGLMCSECFNYEGLVSEHIQRKLSINPQDVRKINIKGKMLVQTRDDVVTIPLVEAKEYARRPCTLCNDFSSEFADISAGGLGLEGYTFTVARTEKGDHLLSRAMENSFLEIEPLEENSPALNLLVRLSKKKRKQQEK